MRFFFVATRPKRTSASEKIWVKTSKQAGGPAPLLFFQIMVEPFDRQLDRLLTLFEVDAVVRDVRDGDVFLLRSGHPVVSEFRVILVVEEFFLLGDDEEDGAIFDLRGLLDGRVIEHLVADRGADQI